MTAHTKILAVAAATMMFAAAAASAQQSPPEVTIAKPVVKELAEWQEFTGQFVAVDHVEVRARVAGYIDIVHFEDGAMVEKDQLLYTVDRRPYQIALENAQAVAAQAEASLELAEVQLRRTERLTEDDFASKALYDERLASRNGAEAALKAAQAAARSAELNLAFTEVRAPVAGRVSYNRVTVGNLVNGESGQGAALTTIVSTAPIYFEFDMSESDFLDLEREHRAGRVASTRAGEIAVQVRLFDEDGFDRSGRLSFVDNVVDRGTGTIRGRATFDNAEGYLTPGQFGILRMPGTEVYPAILVPDEALVSDQSNKLVMTLDANDVVRPVVVRPGPGEFGLRVIRKGLTGDERIIINGLARARPGQPVTPVEGEIVLGDGRL